MRNGRIGAMSPRRVALALLSILVSFAALGLLEVGLRASGFGQSYPLFVEVEDAPDYLRTNPDVVRRFMSDESDTPNLWIRPVSFPREKTPGTFRILVQGGSTAEGYPYGYGASLSGRLQQRLQRTFPDRRIEVVTTAMSAVNSYTLLDFTSEIIEQAPDAVLIYAGHNEYVGLLGAGSGFSVGRRPTVLAFLWVRDLRIFQLAQRVVVGLQNLPGERQPKRDRRRTLMATIVGEQRIPHGSALYDLGAQQYRANMRGILSRYREAGVPVFIGTLVCNERDQAPFISGHGEGADAEAWSRHFDAGEAALESGDAAAALLELEVALALDSDHAEGHYAVGRALDRLGRYAEARQAYLAAKDRDQLRFRAPEAMNQIIRELAAEQGARVVEVQAAFARQARNGIVGADLMLEHLHPNLRGYFVMADAFYESLRAEGVIGTWQSPVSAEQAWAESPVTEVDRLYGEYRIARLTSDWPFTSEPKELELPNPTTRVELIARNYYRGRHRWPEAMRRLLEHYRSMREVREGARVAVLLAEAFPHDWQDQRLAAELLLRARRPGARVYLERALARASPEAREALIEVKGDLAGGNSARALQRLSSLR